MNKEPKKNPRSGLTSIEDLRDRSWVDDITGCWHWRGSCKRYPTTWLPAMKRHVTLGLAIYHLQHGELPPKGRVMRSTCDTKHCVNPKHRVESSFAEAMKGAQMRHTPATRAKMSALKRAKSKITDADAEAIRQSDAPALELANRYGISDSYVKKIQLGTAWTPMGAPGSSVFNWSQA